MPTPAIQNRLAAPDRASIRDDLWFTARVLAGCVGLCVAVSVLAFLRNPSFDPSIWWLDLRWLPIWARPILPAAVAGALVAYAARPRMRPRHRAASVGVVAAASAIAIADAARYYALWAGEVIDPRSPLPASLAVAAVLLLIVAAMRRPRASPTSSRIALTAVVVGAFVVGVPLLQILAFGTTDYRRPADAIVVFGAKVRPDGAPSIILAERVTRASELYAQGTADLVVMTGGIEPTGADETEVMRDLAIAQGVPAEAIVLDRAGLNTSASVDSTMAILRRRGLSSVLVVSQPYHLPRIKLAYARAGTDVWTVPADVTLVPGTGLVVGREIPALWLYYLRAAFR